jgi:hypothetical protein
MTKRLFVFLLVITAMRTRAQTNLLVLEKNGENVKTYSAGMDITIQTIYHQWFDGVITAIRSDSIFVNGFPFHYKEIEAIRRDRKKLNYEADGVLLMVAGGGVLVLGVVNGLYRGDKANSWFTATSYVTAAALLGGGYLLTKSRYKYYRLGKKYTLQYLALDLNKKQ